MRHPAISPVLTIAFAVCATWIAGTLHAFEIEDHARFGDPGAAREIRIISTADITFFEPMIAAFLSANPEVTVDYTVASSTELSGAVTNAANQFDVVISSAMDLQTKLANDGRAMRHQSDVTEMLPDWAVWNDMLFAFTQEPATIILSKTALGALPVPQSRHDLINLLRQHPDRFRGKVGTYDIRQSGLGYLFATQDTRASETYWRLTEVMGRLGARLYCCSSEMIDAVKSGELLIAYNVLGSYAANRSDRDEFAIVLPTDFTTVMLRTAMIPENAPAPDLAAAFVDHLLQMAHGPQARPLTHTDINLTQLGTALNRIRIGPGLLVFLDQLKRRAFLAEWENAIEQN
ncbi:ABC transporter substrate-binding protein [Shimia biformata]|uniref:ABC transporter substrate-binding protein n=1 Tax=Shimia biformata TaxID=1294299 RepID=UPI001950CF8C|nr:ABC transporter substrate-binding protein [Shimia biformata]